MSKTKQNIPKSQRGGYDLWGKRPGKGAGKPQNPYWKRICRRVERRMKPTFINQDLRAEGL